MKRIFSYAMPTLLVASVALISSSGIAPARAATSTVKVFDAVQFYDGYLMSNNPDKDLDDGILRHSTSLYSVPLTEEQIEAIGDSLQMNVFVHACCDNYDRIGNINLALVPKGASTYTTADVDRIELARFITPFMDKNKEPSTVPYTYDVQYLAPLLHDVDLRAKYDLWIEMEIFGVPYAANKQVAGCEGRSDVFKGTLEFVSRTPGMGDTQGNVLVPIVIKRPEYKGGNLNNYNATDTAGTTVKTYTYTVPRDVKYGNLVVITSNHGANEGGEEYNRRWHYLYADDELKLRYKPGRKSCEPFRKYNTQPNGIYGKLKRFDAVWQSFSNWCPGDVIDNRIIELGPVSAGTHTVRISVPDAKFADKQGDIPVSIYFHGSDQELIDASTDAVSVEEARLSVALDSTLLRVTAPEEIVSVEIHSVAGQRMHFQWLDTPVDVSGYPSGLYLVTAEMIDGLSETHKVVIR